ncbi:MAG: V-type ATP synthase subunit D, partial [candidate division WOR-3 bacterium]
ENITPTRMNMLIKKRQIKVAESGASLLKNKRDALLSEFLNLIKPLLKEYKELDEILTKAVNTLIFALGKDGSEELRSAALASAKELILKMKEKKVWGVSIPEIEKKDGKKNILLRGYSPFSVTTRIDETADSFEILIDKILSIVPLEIRFKRIGEEIKKTTRRVNALEQKIIPQLKEEVNYIRRVLEDREREDKFRMKLLKKKRV